MSALVCKFSGEADKIVRVRPCTAQVCGLAPEAPVVEGRGEVLAVPAGHGVAAPAVLDHEGHAAVNEVRSDLRKECSHHLLKFVPTGVL